MAEPEARTLAYQAHTASRDLQRHLTQLRDASPGAAGELPGGLTAKDAAGITRSALWAIGYLSAATEILAESAEFEGAPQTRIRRGTALLQAACSEIRAGIEALPAAPAPPHARDFPAPPLSASNLAAIAAAAGKSAGVPRRSHPEQAGPRGQALLATDRGCKPAARQHPRHRPAATQPGSSAPPPARPSGTADAGHRSRRAAYPARGHLHSRRAV